MTAPTPEPAARLPWPRQVQLMVDNGDGTATVHSWLIDASAAEVLQFFLGDPHIATLMPVTTITDASAAAGGDFIALEG